MLRGFLDFTEFYKRFIKGYAQIASPMTDLLKKNYFYWSKMGKDIKKYVKKCVICQQVKPSNNKSVGFLMPLPIPSFVWQDISMDFITDLPKVMGKQ